MADPPASYVEIAEQLGLPVGSIGPDQGPLPGTPQGTARGILRLS